MPDIINRDDRKVSNLVFEQREKKMPINNITKKLVNFVKKRGQIAHQRLDESQTAETRFMAVPKTKPEKVEHVLLIEIE